ELVARDPLRVEGVKRRSEAGLVVGDVGDRRVAVDDPVAEGRPAGGEGLRGVSDGLGGYFRRPHLPLARGTVMKGDVARKLADLDRRERGRDVTRDSLLERGLRGGRAPDRDLRLLLE